MEERKIPEKCCPEYVKTACRSDGQIYKPGEKWRSLTDNCVIETCVGPNITKRKEIEVCSTQCSPVRIFIIYSRYDFNNFAFIYSNRYIINIALVNF